jgi:hypothetical protein
MMPVYFRASTCIREEDAMNEYAEIRCGVGQDWMNAEL